MKGNDHMKLFKNKKNIVLVGLVGLNLLNMSNSNVSTDALNIVIKPSSNASMGSGNILNNPVYSNNKIENNAIPAVNNESVGGPVVESSGGPVAENGFIVLPNGRKINVGQNKAELDRQKKQEEMLKKQEENQEEEKKRQEEIIQKQKKLQNDQKKLQEIQKISNSKLEKIVEDSEDALVDSKDAPVRGKKANLAKKSKDKKRNSEKENNVKLNKKDKKEFAKIFKDLSSNESVNVLGEWSSKTVDLIKLIDEVKEDEIEDLFGEDGKIFEFLDSGQVNDDDENDDENDDDENDDEKSKSSKSSAPYNEILKKIAEKVDEDDKLDDVQKVKKLKKDYTDLLEKLKLYVSSGDIKSISKDKFPKTIKKYVKIVDSLKSDSADLEDISENFSGFSIVKKELKNVKEAVKKSDDEVTGKKKKLNKKGTEKKDTEKKDPENKDTGKIKRLGDKRSPFKERPAPPVSLNNNKDVKKGNDEQKKTEDPNKNLSSDDIFKKALENYTSSKIDDKTLEERKSTFPEVYRLLTKLDAVKAKELLSGFEKLKNIMVEINNKKNMDSNKSNEFIGSAIRTFESTILEILGKVNEYYKTEFSNYLKINLSDVKAKQDFIVKLGHELTQYYIPWSEERNGFSYEAYIRNNNKNMLSNENDLNRSKFLAYFCSLILDKDKKAEYETLINKNKNLYQEILVAVSNALDNELVNVLNGLYNGSMAASIISGMRAKLNASSFSMEDVSVLINVIDREVVPLDKKNGTLFGHLTKTKAELLRIFAKYAYIGDSSATMSAITESRSNRYKAFSAIVSMFDEAKRSFEIIKYRSEKTSVNYMVGLNFIFSRIIPDNFKVAYNALQTGTVDPNAVGYDVDENVGLLNRIFDFVDIPLSNLKSKVVNVSYANESEKDFILRKASTKKFLKTMLPVVVLLNRFMKFMTTSVSQIDELKQDPSFSYMANSVFLNDCKKYDSSNSNMLNPEYYITNILNEKIDENKKRGLLIYDLLYAMLTYEIVVFRELIIPPTYAGAEVAANDGHLIVPRFYLGLVKPINPVLAATEIGAVDAGAAGNFNAARKPVAANEVDAKKFLNCLDKTVKGASSISWANAALSYARTPGDPSYSSGGTDAYTKDYYQQPIEQVSAAHGQNVISEPGAILKLNENKVNIIVAAMLNAFHSGNLGQVYRQVFDVASLNLVGSDAEKHKQMNILFGNNVQSDPTVTTLMTTNGGNFTSTNLGANDYDTVQNNILGVGTFAGLLTALDNADGRAGSAFGVRLVKSAAGAAGRAMDVTDNRDYAGFGADNKGIIAYSATNGAGVAIDSVVGDYTNLEAQLPVICKRNLFNASNSASATHQGDMFLCYSVLVGPDTKVKKRTGTAADLIGRKALEFTAGTEKLANLTLGTKAVVPKNAFKIDKIGASDAVYNKSENFNSHQMLINLFDTELPNMLKDSYNKEIEKVEFADIRFNRTNNYYDVNSNSVTLNDGNVNLAVNETNILDVITHSALKNSTSLWNEFLGDAFDVNEAERAAFMKEDGSDYGTYRYDGMNIPNGSDPNIFRQIKLYMEANPQYRL
jgi:hypothetical protein